MTRTVMLPFVCEDNDLTLWPVALSSLPVSWKYLAGPTTGVCQGCWSHIWENKGWEQRHRAKREQQICHLGCSRTDATELHRELVKSLFFIWDTCPNESILFFRVSKPQMNQAIFPRSSSYFCSLTKYLILALSSTSCFSAILTATSVIFFRSSAFFYQLSQVSIASGFTLSLSASNATCWSIKQLCNSAKTCFIFLMDTSSLL